MRKLSEYEMASLEREHYITWLASRVDAYVGITYSRLLHCLWEIPFVWSIDDDRNRAIDGNTLRTIYKQSHKVVYPEVVFPFDDGCTFLEFLIALCGRANDLMYEPGNDKTGEFFWQIVTNACLDHCTDDAYGKTWDDFYVSSKIAYILSRSYEFNGLGGLFPLKNATENQQNVPIWYQMNAFLNENF